MIFFKKNTKPADKIDGAPDSKLSIQELRSIVETPKTVGSAEELVPFAWRNPLQISVKNRKTSKTLKALALAEQERDLLGSGKDSPAK